MISSLEKLNLIVKAALSATAPGKKPWMEGERGEEERGAVSKQEWEKQRQTEGNKPHREKKTQVLEEGKGMKGRCKSKNSDKQRTNGLETERQKVWGEGGGEEELE